MPGPATRDVYFDIPLGNMAVRAFQGTEDFVGPRLVPPVDVPKPSGNYYTIDKDTWLLIARDLRGERTSPNRIDFKVSSDTYGVKNRALAHEVAKETLAAADTILRYRENAVRLLSEGLARSMEDRIASLLTSITNIGSGVTLAGGDQWSDSVNSDPKAAVNTGHAFGENNTGLRYNTAVIDKDTYRILRNHPKVRDYTKFVAAGPIADAALKEFLEVDNLWVARGIKNAALEGATASIVNIWGKNVLLARVEPALGPETATLALQFRWAPEGIPGPFQVERYDHWDPGMKSEIVQVGYYADEKVVAKQLGYLIGSTIAYGVGNAANGVGGARSGPPSHLAPRPEESGRWNASF